MSKKDEIVQMEELEIGGALYPTRLTSKFRNRKEWVRPDERKVIAVIPGTIQKLMVSAGDEVAAGDSMLILEATSASGHANTKSALRCLVFMAIYPPP